MVDDKVMERNALGQFKKGHVETMEEKIKRSQSLSQQWRNRPEYIGDIVNECPRLYNSWRSIRFTKKGKKAGCCQEWSDYRQFYNDVRPSFKDGYRLIRKDISLPWSPNNFMWATDKEVGMFKSQTYLTYNGETLTLSQWADKLGVSSSALAQRYYKHKDDWPIEHILKGKPRSRNSKVVRDISDDGTKLRAKASKMISSYRCKDRSAGLQECNIDINWMVANILLKPCFYCGDTYRIGCDRIDNTKGHTKDNVVPCCIECNTARNNFFSFDEMKVLGKTIAEIKAQRPSIERGKSIEKIHEEATWDAEHGRQMHYKVVYQFSPDGALLNEYQGAQAAADAVGGTAKTIGAAVNGKTHGKGIVKHLSYGFYWSHEKDFNVKYLNI